MPKAIITQYNARDLPLPRHSVDLIITSPPYWAQRTYVDNGADYDGQIGAERSPQTYIGNLIECTQEWLRVLKPRGSLFVNLGDKYAGGDVGSNNGLGASTLASHHTARDYALNEITHSRASTLTGGKARLAGAYSAFVMPEPPDYGGIPTLSLIGLPWRYALACIDDLGLILRAEIVWDKWNGLPESVTDRVQRKHEQWFHFVKAPGYWSNMDTIREGKIAPYLGQQFDDPEYGHKSKGAGAEYYGTKWNSGKKGAQGGGYTKAKKWVTPHPRGSRPSSVWHIPTEPLHVPPRLGLNHYAAFPTEWPRRLIKAWCPPGGVVLDPFGGTGTTALVAQELGRVGISNDLSADYCRLAKWRTTDRKEIERFRRHMAKF